MQTESTSNNNPYLIKVLNSSNSVSSLVECEEILQSMSQTREVLDALSKCQELKEAFKNSLYSQYGKGSTMLIDDEFQLFLEDVHTKAESDDLKILVEWLQADIGTPVKAYETMIQEEESEDLDTIFDEVLSEAKVSPLEQARKLKAAAKNRGDDYKSKESPKDKKKTTPLSQLRRRGEDKSITRDGKRAYSDSPAKEKSDRQKDIGAKKLASKSTKRDDTSRTGAAMDSGNKKRKFGKLSRGKMKADVSKKGKKTSKKSAKKSGSDDAPKDGGSRLAASRRFISYDSPAPGRRKHPKPRAPEQTGKNKYKIDGDLKGRFERYYGKDGEKVRNIVKNKIANGTQNKSGLALGRKRGLDRSRGRNIADKE